MTTSKKLLFGSWLFFSALILLKVLGFDVDVPLEVVGGLATGIVSGFYMWKSKAENKVKITIGMLGDLAEKYGIENVIELIKEVIE